MRISLWLWWTGIIEANVKETLKLTIDELFNNCPKNVSKNSIRESQRHYERDKEFREISLAHAKIFMWSKESESSKSKSSKKAISHEKSAVFNKAQVHTPDNNYDRSTSSPPVKQVISLPIDHQGAIVKYYHTFVEHKLYRLLVNNENIIPATVVESFITGVRRGNRKYESVHWRKMIC